MKVTPLDLPGLLLLEPQAFEDDRGFFAETYSEPRYREAGVTCSFVQDNHARSRRGTLRGLHYQSSPGQAKLVSVARGRVFDVAVDIRPESPTFGKWRGVYLDDQNHHQLFMPVGFAHGYCVMSEVADITYKVSSVYDPKTETGLLWNDPELGVEWPVPEPLLSVRDQTAETFAEYRKRVAR